MQTTSPELAWRVPLRAAWPEIPFNIPLASSRRPQWRLHPGMRSNARNTTARDISSPDPMPGCDLREDAMNLQNRLIVPCTKVVARYSRTLVSALVTVTALCLLSGLVTTQAVAGLAQDLVTYWNFNGSGEDAYQATFGGPSTPPIRTAPPLTPPRTFRLFDTVYAGAGAVPRSGLAGYHLRTGSHLLSLVSCNVCRASTATSTIAISSWRAPASEDPMPTRSPMA